MKRLRDRDVGDCQLSVIAGSIILTGQEAPETHKRLREDLYKKTMSADGISGRKPYGIATRMFELVGWKRLEANKIMKFAGVTDSNFPSILRSTETHHCSGLYETHRVLSFFLMATACF